MRLFAYLVVSVIAAFPGISLAEETLCTAVLDDEKVMSRPLAVDWRTAKAGWDEYLRTTFGPRGDRDTTCTTSFYTGHADSEEVHLTPVYRQTGWSGGFPIVGAAAAAAPRPVLPSGALIVESRPVATWALPRSDDPVRQKVNDYFSTQYSGDVHEKKRRALIQKRKAGCCSIQ